MIILRIHIPMLQWFHFRGENFHLEALVLMPQECFPMLKAKTAETTENSTYERLHAQKQSQFLQPLLLDKNMKYLLAKG